MRLKFSLSATPPFRLDLTVGALRRRPHNAIDRFEGGVWRRVLLIDGRPCGLAVRQVAPATHPKIQVVATGPAASRAHRKQIAAAVRQVLGLDADLGQFYRIAARDPVLKPMARRLRGMKPPRYPTVFEAFANAVSCQLLSLTAGMHVLNRITEVYGIECEADGVTMRSAPSAAALAQADPAKLRTLGLSRRKANYLIGLARSAIDPTDPDFGSLGAADDAAALERLSQIRGVGRWTAEYVLLRGLGRLHVFPGDDVGGQNHLAKWLGVRRALDHKRVSKLVERWHPYEGLIYFHLLVDGLLSGDVNLRRKRKPKRRKRKPRKAKQ